MYDKSSLLADQKYPVSEVSTGLFDSDDRQVKSAQSQGSKGQHVRDSIRKFVPSSC